MIDYCAELEKDIRFQEGLKSCLNCGVCCAICPAAEFYNYDPRSIVTLVQQRNNETIENLLKSDTIWYCGQCMSCKTRCPRGNTAGMIIQALRTLSQKLGFFTESEKGRQQYALKKVIGENILNTGYCLSPELVAPELHVEQGPMWKWVIDNKEAVYERMGANFKKPGPGALRKISDEALNELAQIFEVTGGKDFYNTIEEQSNKKAEEMNLDTTNGAMNDYMVHVYTHNSGTHS
ncbi:MAG: 4Fe-4S dicluster domain-containing protein [Bacteroidales bacterium]|jgi:heterodisulfide reductase subunit C|nr:4Fe-4S dicluster domain-containing protein [Bacteroidales bacterium]